MAREVHSGEDKIPRSWEVTSECCCAPSTSLRHLQMFLQLKVFIRYPLFLMSFCFSNSPKIKLCKKREPFGQICPVAYATPITQTGYPFIITHQSHHPQPPSIPNSPFFNTLAPFFHIRPSIRIVLNSRTAPATARIGALVKALKARPAAAEAATEPCPKGDRLWLLPPLLHDNDAGRRRRDGAMPVMVPGRLDFDDHAVAAIVVVVCSMRGSGTC